MTTAVEPSNIGHLENDAEHAHKVLEEIEYLKHNIDVEFLQIAERLYDVADRKWFLIYGNDTFEEFISSIHMSRAWVYELLRIHKTYVLEHGIDQNRLANVGVTKLAVLAKDVNEKNIDNMLDLAESDISVDDLKRELGRKAELPTGENGHQILPAGYYHIMPAESVNVVGDTLGRRSVELIETDVGMVIKVG
jgi:hypothetical protein